MGGEDRKLGAYFSIFNKTRFVLHQPLNAIAVDFEGFHLFLSNYLGLFSYHMVRKHGRSKLILD